MVLALCAIFVVGALVGAALSFAVPAAGMFAYDRARAGLLADTGASLERAAQLANDEDDPALFPSGALANMLLAVDHAGGAAERKRADAYMKSSLGFVRGAPESLYARALLKRGGVEDDALDDDIARRADDKSNNAFWLLARATRTADGARTKDAVDEGFALVQKAAFGGDAPLKAQVELARALILRGEYGDARATAERIERRSPDHAQGRVAGILAAVLDDAREETPEERAVKLKKVKQQHAGKRRDGPPKPGEPHDDADTPSLALWHTAQEDQALERLDDVAERDQPLVALLLEALAAGRGDDELAGRMRARVVPAVERFPLLAARQAELFILEGDAPAAEELLGSALDKAPEDTTLLLDQARLHALSVVPPDELRRRANAFARAVTLDGVVLPFGRFAFDAQAPSLPLRPQLDPALVPDAALVAAARSGAVGGALAAKLDVIVLVHKGDTALARGDLAGANEASARAREKAAADPEVLLLDARIRLHQSERQGARDAINAAINAAPEDPHVLLTAARLHYDNEDFIPARKALGKLKALGLKSPAALALDAMIEARGGDAKSAQAALAEAQSMGADDVEMLRASVLLLRDGKDLEPVRKAADKLVTVDQLRTSDPILRVWEADAVARTGDTPRARNVLEQVIAARPNLADAHLVLGSIQAITDADRAAASFARAVELAPPKSAIALEAARRRALLPGVAPPKRKRPPR